MYEFECMKLTISADVIYVIDEMSGGETRLPLEKPDENHYRNLWSRHAPSFFRRYIERIGSLSLIPIDSTKVGYLDNVVDAKLRPELVREA